MTTAKTIHGKEKSFGRLAEQSPFIRTLPLPCVTQKAPRSANTALYPNHEDLIAENGSKSLSHCNLVQKQASLPHATRVTDAKAAGDKEWEKLEHITSMASDGRQEQEGGHRKGAEKKNGLFTLPRSWTYATELGVGAAVPRTQKVVWCSEVLLRKTVLALLQCSRSRGRRHHK